MNRGSDAQAIRNRDVFLLAGLMRGAAATMVGGSPGFSRHRRGMAQRAVDAHPRKADRHLRQADRHLVAVLAEDAERRVPARARQVLGKDAGQHQPDPVGHALLRLGADRSEQKVLFVRREVRGRRLAEELHVRHAADDRSDDDHDEQRRRPEMCDAC